MSDAIKFAPNVLCSSKLSVTSDFDVADTVLITAVSGNISGVGTMGCGAITTTGDFDVGTANFTVAAITGNTAVSGTFKATGALDLDGSTMTSNGSGTLTLVGWSDGTASLSSHNLAGIGSIGCGAITTTGNFDVGTAKFTVAAISGNTAVSGTFTATGALNLDGSTMTSNGSGTLTLVGWSDGTASLSSSNLAGIGSIGCGAITTTGNFDVGTAKFTVAAATGNTVIAGTLDVTGAITGTISMTQFKTNQATTLNKDGATWTTLSTITGTTGTFILMVEAHTDDTASSMWLCSSDGMTGSCSRLASSAGTMSTDKIEARWSAATAIEIKYETSWGGGTGAISGYAVAISPAAN